MKYGSMNNWIEEGMGNSKKLEIGMGITILYYTDRIPATIISISSSGKSFKAQKDNAKRVDNNGASESQEYIYERNEKGEIHEFRMGRNGRFYTKGGQKNGLGCIIGMREKYFDFSF